MKNISLLSFIIAFSYFSDGYANIFSLPLNENVLYESSNPLNEYIIYTPDKKCFMHYLSSFEIKDGLSLQVQSETNEGTCLQKGFSKVQISDAQNNIAQTIEGYFLNGFFIGNLPLNSYAIKRSSDETGSQYLYYFIDKNEELGITYIGKMKAEEINGTYSSFNACPVFEILLQTQNKDLFKEQSTIQNLFTVAKSYAQTLCPQVETIVFAATDSPSLSDNGIFFQEYLNKDYASGLWFANPEKSFNYAVVSNPKNREQETNPEQIILPLKKTTLYTIHISDKTNDKVLFVDEPYLMKAIHNETTRTMKKNAWYQVKANLSLMSDLEKKKSGISLNEKAAMIDIHTAKYCKDKRCLSEE